MPHRFVQLVLVRHGETEWSRLGRHTGRTDIGLTEDGRAQARFLAPALAKWRFAKVLTSPLARATETCRLAGLADQAEVRPDLAEWHYGEYEGLVHDEIEARHPGWDLWRHGCPGGESPEQVASRVDRVIAEVRELAHAPGPSSPSGPSRAAGIVVAFAHGHILRALATRWVGLRLEHGGIFDLDTATVSTLGTDHDRPVVVTWNDAHHLG